MSDCCFGNPRYSCSYAETPPPRRIYGELTYVPVPDKILTTKEYREKLRRNRQKSGSDYLYS
jgi:hypothetical protein